MAIFYLGARAVTRGKQRGGIVGLAAYNSRTQLHDDARGRLTKDYARKDGLLFAGIFAPKDAPDWARDRQQLWNRVETSEKRIDAQLARELIVAAPHELTPEQVIGQVKDFVREQFVRRGMVADVTVHAPDSDGDSRNTHVHILLTLRPLDGDGFAAKKNRDWNSRASMNEWKQAWEKLSNRNLERFGHASRIDHRSHKERGSGIEPNLHLGAATVALERKGIRTERGDLQRGIDARNRARFGKTKHVLTASPLARLTRRGTRTLSHTEQLYLSAHAADDLHLHSGAAALGQSPKEKRDSALRRASPQMLKALHLMQASHDVYGHDGLTSLQRLVAQMHDLKGHAAEWLRQFIYDGRLLDRDHERDDHGPER